MYKKAGIVVGVACFVLAIVIFVIVTLVTKNGDKPEGQSSTPQTSQSQQVTTKPQQTQPVETTSQQTQPVETKPIQSSAAQVAPVTSIDTTVQTEPVQTEPVQTEPVQTEPVQTEPVQTEPVDASQTSADVLTLIAPDSLPAHTDTTDIGRVVGRNIYERNGQLIYSLLINTTVNGQLEYFTTLKNYNIADGTQVECSLRTFTTASGASYPSIISVTIS